MGAPENNQFWKMRSRHGRERIFTTPAILWDACCEYFESVDANPMMKNEAVKSPKSGKDYVSVPTEKPYSLKGLCLFLGVNSKYFNDFEDGLRGKTDDISKEFSEVITRVHDIIFVQKYNGSVAGNFNPKIIAVELGFNETINVESIMQPVVNISLPGMPSTFGKLNENNVEEAVFEEVKPVALTELND